MITIINYGMGNLGSVQNMFKKLKVQCNITSDEKEIAVAEKILLPGVGAFDSAMIQLESSGLMAVLNQKAIIEKIPVLGICLGMQLLTKDSEEGQKKGLGWIDAHTYKFKVNGDSSMKIPHMGWNEVHAVNPSPLTSNFKPDARFYFVHSYYVKVSNPSDSVMQTHYGIDFDSIIQRGNIFGAQFHPEKSHTFGMQLFRNFADL